MPNTPTYCDYSLVARPAPCGVRPALIIKLSPNLSLGALEFGCMSNLHAITNTVLLIQKAPNCSSSRGFRFMG